MEKSGFTWTVFILSRIIILFYLILSVLWIIVSHTLFFFCQLIWGCSVNTFLYHCILASRAVLFSFLMDRLAGGELLGWRLFLSVLCHCTPFSPMLFLMRSQLFIILLLFLCMWWVLFFCCFQDFLLVIGLKQLDCDMSRYNPVVIIWVS